jgi:basic membrane lipoprotein Med (substrate-binding protein (PBP1-ABC) superfamily)/class 3 adenylate cyclase
MAREQRLQVKCSTLTIVLLSVLVSWSSLSDATAPASMKLCYLYFGTIEDLGWTFSFNQGRLAAHTELAAMFPGTRFESIFRESVFFSSDRSLIVNDFIKEGCRVIFSNNALLLDSQDDYFTARFPNVSFVLLNDDKLHDTQYPNRIYVGFAFGSAYYLGGVAAAAEATNRICFSAAWEAERNPNDAANGFMLGVRSLNSTIPIELVTMNSWNDPDADVALGKVFVEMGCDVIGRYSDPRSMDVYVESQRLTKRNVFTVPPHSNLQQYVGDSVLTAIYTNWGPKIVEIVSDIITSGNPDPQKVPYSFGLASGGVAMSPISALGNTYTNSVVVDSHLRLFQRSDDVYCDSSLMFNNGSRIRIPSGKVCIDSSFSLPRYLDLNQTDHGAFELYTSCTPGTYYSYSTSPKIQLNCLPCPANTFSISFGAKSCSACPKGKVSSPGSIGCTTGSIFPPEYILLIVAPLALILLGLSWGIYYLRRKAEERNKYAPKEAPLCLLFTDIEDSTTMWNLHPGAMSEAIELHHEIIRQCISDSKGYEVKTVGDSFMIATKSALDGVMLALDIQRRLFEADWPSEFRSADFGSNVWNGFKVRIGVHYCREVQPKYEAFRQYFDYYGADVNACSRIEACARGGQVLIDSSTLGVMKTEPEYDALIADDVSIKLFAKDVQLKGLNKNYTLFSVTPVEFASRYFLPLPGHERDAMQSFDTPNESLQTSTTTPVSPNSPGLGTQTPPSQSLSTGSHEGKLNVKQVALLLDAMLAPCPFYERQRLIDSLAHYHQVVVDGQARQLHWIARHALERAPKQRRLQRRLAGLLQLEDVVE